MRCGWRKIAGNAYWLAGADSALVRKPYGRSVWVVSVYLDGDGDPVEAGEHPTFHDAIAAAEAVLAGHTQQEDAT